MKIRKAYREKRIISGNYVEIEITPSIITNRKKKINIEDKEIYNHIDIDEKEKIKIQEKNRKAYEKRRKKEFTRLAHCNFTENDYAVHFTYSSDNLPGSLEEAEKQARNYIRRLSYKRKKKGLDDIKYLLVTEYGQSEEGLNHVHHHMIINGGLTRDEIEDTWSIRKKSIGYVNTRRLQFDKDTGLKDLCAYLMKKPEGKRKWTGSKNLKRPEIHTNYYKYSRRKVKNIIKNGIDDRSLWESIYSKYTFKSASHIYNDYLGDLLYINFISKEKTNE